MTPTKFKQLENEISEVLKPLSCIQINNLINLVRWRHREKEYSISEVKASIFELKANGKILVEANGFIIKAVNFNNG